MKLWTFKDGELYFNNKGLGALAKVYERPTYYYDVSLVSQRADLYSNVLYQNGHKNDKIFYALKANSYSAVLSGIHRSGMGVDVVSGGEIRIAMTNGFSPAEIIFSGVGKTVDEIAMSLDLGIRQINVESVSELKRIVTLAEQKKRHISVVFRINPDVDVQTHPYIATGFRDNKFGMSQTDLPELFQIVKKSTYVKWQGISIHIGSQILELKNLDEAFSKTRKLVDSLNSQGHQVHRCDLGGGLGIFYDKQNFQTEESLLLDYGKLVSQYFGDLGCERQFEPGRWIVAHAGFLLCQVQYIKNNGYKTFVILDSGMNHLLRPSLYGAYHEIYPLIERAGHAEYEFVGPICESGDFIAKQRKSSFLQEGDFVVIADTGAYGFTMANHYNAHLLPIQAVF